MEACELQGLSDIFFSHEAPEAERLYNLLVTGFVGQLGALTSCLMPPPYHTASQPILRQPGMVDVASEGLEGADLHSISP